MNASYCCVLNLLKFHSYSTYLHINLFQMEQTQHSLLQMGQETAFHRAFHRVSASQTCLIVWKQLISQYAFVAVKLASHFYII